MEKTKSKSNQNSDSRRFNENASRLLIGLGGEAVISLFNSLDYDCVVMDQGKFQLSCPVCNEGNVLLLAGGDVYPLLWRCQQATCPSKQDRSFKNLVGLVRACNGGDLGAAYKSIAAHLGYSNPFSITNMTEAQVAEAINGEPADAPDADYVFLVADLVLKRQLEQIGFYAVFFGGDYDAPQIRRKYVVVVLPENGEAVAQRLRNGRNFVVSHDPALFKGLNGYNLKQRVASVIRMAASRMT